jgi:DNA-binding response OmpR family regulator
MNGRNAEIVRFGPFRFVAWRRTVARRRGSPFAAARELSVLATLAARPGVVTSKQELMDAVLAGHLRH